MGAFPASAASLERFVPRLAVEWDDGGDGPRWRSIPGTLCFVDISGFTSLSEKLARRGRIGAEELTEVLNRVFGSMLELAYARGGSLLKFGGDALLLIFTGEQRILQGCSAAVEMRAALREAAQIQTSVGRVPLKMSVGVHDGTVDVFSVGGSHRELIISGPTATMTTTMEATAEAGEILVSPDVALALPAGSADVVKGAGRVLRWRGAKVAPSGATTRAAVDADAYEACVPRALRDHLDQHRAESEHRLATIAFLKFKGVDGLLASDGPEGVASALDELVRSVQSGGRRRSRHVPRDRHRRRRRQDHPRIRSSDRSGRRRRARAARCVEPSWTRRTVSRSESAYIVGTSSAARSARPSVRRTR